MKLFEKISKLNELKLWNRKIRFNDLKIQSTTFDRILYLYLNRLNLMGRTDRVIYHKYIKPGMNIVDIGANIGLHSIIFSNIVGNEGKVYSFEPEKALFQAINETIKINNLNNVKAYNIALGEKAQNKLLYRSAFNSGDNRLAKENSLSLMEGAVVSVERLDKILCNKRVDFVKMDVQGWEIHVLEGMDDIFKRNPNLIVYFEYWPRGLRMAGKNPTDLLTLLKNYGLSIFRMERNSENEIHDLNKITNSSIEDQTINFIARYR